MSESKIPQVGDKFYPGFEDEYLDPPKPETQLVRIAKIGQMIEMDGHEGRAVFVEDQGWYDCFWSTKLKQFVAVLET
jgi:hypothetical protein